MNGGRCAIRFTRRYDATLGEVWHALTDGESLARWLAPPAGVSVLRSEPERILELDWSPPGEPPSVVRMELRADGARTVLVVDHNRIDAARGMRYMRDWGRTLERFDTELDTRRRRR